MFLFFLKSFTIHGYVNMLSPILQTPDKLDWFYFILTDESNQIKITVFQNVQLYYSQINLDYVCYYFI